MKQTDEEQPSSGLFQAVFLPVRLICVSGSLQGREFEQWGSHLVLGRSTGNDIVLSEETASKVHARIVCEDGVYYLEDLKSNNGTYLQGRPIEREKLQNGHVFRIGETAFRFETLPKTEANTTRFWTLATIALGLLLVAGLIFVAVTKHW